ncbi:MAG: DUF885 domain-containing protein, partial [Pseudomonadota bacterium]
MRLQIAFAAIGLASLTACGQANTSQSVADKISEGMEMSEAEREANTAALNEWFEVKFEESVARSPMTSTFLGSRERYDELDDVSPEAAEEELAIERANIAEMRERFDQATLTDQGALSFRLAEYNLESAERMAKWRDHSYPFNQMFGAQSRLPAFMIAQHKVTSFEDGEAYVARLNAAEIFLGQHLANAQRAAENGIRPPLFVYDYIIADSENVIAGDPFFGDFQSPLMADFVAKIDALSERGEITDAQYGVLLTGVSDALLDKVGPAYQAIIDHFETDRANATTDDGAWKLPDGEAYYADRLKQMTTTDMTADEIHDLGLAEVARIHDEMEAIMQQVGFEGTLQDFFEFTRTDAQFFYPNTDEGRERYLSEATVMIDTMREALPDYFNTFPKAEMVVKRVESFREKSAGKAFYQRPAPDGSRPGVYYANLYRMQDMPVYQMEALA